MPKVISRGKIIIDGKEYDLGDFDDSRGKADGGFYGHGAVDLKNKCQKKFSFKRSNF